jgi:hypothetical protein
MKYFYEVTEKVYCPLSLRERVGVRDSRCPVIAGVSLLPKGGGTKTKSILGLFLYPLYII